MNAVHFDLGALSASERYKLLTAVVVPRPIALVTTVNDDGTVNAAPFSYFNLMGSDPPVIALAPGNRPGGTPKDTARNIRRDHEFVVNLVTEAIAHAMNATAAEFPPGVNELDIAGLTAQPSVVVRAPRIAESPVHLECREHTTLEIGRNRIVIGEVLHLHIRDDLVDAERLHVRADALGLIARMHGRGWYARTTDLFEMPRLTPEQARARREDEA